MGKNNRKRRADKHRQRTRQRGPRPTGTTAFLGPRDLAEILWFEAGEAAEHGEGERLELALERLGGLGATATVALTSCLVAALRDAWEGGWQPVDIARAAGKRLGHAHAKLAAETITMEARSSAGPGADVPDAWASQLRDLARPPGGSPDRPSADEALRLGAELLGMLQHLPVLPQLISPPSRWGRGRTSRPTSPAATRDTRMLEKVRALLAKAESTDFEEEADALTAKAQQLMARHAIDHAMVAGPCSSGNVPEGRRLAIDDPYAQGKAILLSEVAAANRSRTVWMAEYGFSTVIGFATDLDVVEVLYMSLLVQATRAMTRAGSTRDGTGRSRTRSFRRSFLLAFAGRIGERLQAATQAATTDATGTHGSRLLPVLAGRGAAVDDAVSAMFPHLAQTGMRVSNLSGWAAGRAAADLAHIGPEQQLLPGVAV